MEEEIDLRQYLAILVKHWYWIIGVAVIAAITTYVVSLVLTPKYEATALVAIIQPRLQFEFTQDIRTQNLPPNYQAFPLLAISDDLLEQLIQTLNSSGTSSLPDGSPLTISRLKNILNAAPSNDPSLVELQVKVNDPQIAASIANAWATIFVERANTIYGESEAEKELFEVELGQVESELQAIAADLGKISGQTGQGLLNRELLQNASDQEGLVDFRVVERDTYADFGLLGLQLEAKAAALAKNQIRHDSLESLLVRAQTLQELIDQNKVDETASALSLQVELAQLTSQTDPVELKIDINLSEDTALEIKDIISLIESDIMATQVVIEEATTELNQLQAEMATQRQTFDNLYRQYVLKQEVYLSLARKVAEGKIGDGQTNPVRLASSASIPQEPIFPRPLLYTAVGGFLGLIIASFVTIFWQWWTA